MKTLKDLYNTPGLLAELDRLFIESANELALKDMDNGTDVSYVPKNKAVWRSVMNNLESAYGEKKQPLGRKNRSR